VFVKISAADLSPRLGVESFADTTLAKALKRLPDVAVSGPWIAGGAVRRTVQGEKLDSDFDFFFAGEEQANRFASEMLSLGAAQTAATDKATTFLLPAEMPNEGVYLPEMKVQAIRFQYYRDAEAVIDSFDFTLSQFAYDGESVYLGTFALWDVARKRIVIPPDQLRRLLYSSASEVRTLQPTASTPLPSVPADSSALTPGRSRLGAFLEKVKGFGRAILVWLLGDSEAVIGEPCFDCSSTALRLPDVVHAIASSCNRRMVGNCEDCEEPRILTPAGNCSKCGSTSVSLRRAKPWSTAA